MNFFVFFRWNEDLSQTTSNSAESASVGKTEHIFSLKFGVDESTSDN